MDANNELLQAIGQMMDSKLAAALEPIKDDLSDVKERVTKIELVQEDIKDDLSVVKQRVTKIELVQENITNKTLSLIQEGMIGTNDKFRRLDQLEDTLDDHGHRIWALEQVVKAQ